MKSRFDKTKDVVYKYCSKFIDKDNERQNKEGYEYGGDGGILTRISRICGRTDFIELLYKEIPKYLNHKSQFNKFKKEVDELWIPWHKDIIEMNVYEMNFVEEVNKYKSIKDDSYSDNWLR